MKGRVGAKEGLRVGVALLLAVPAPPAQAALKKGMWGPAKVNGASEFPVYRELGATVYNATLSWRNVAAGRPTNPRDPRDPAYVSTTRTEA